MKDLKHYLKESILDDIEDQIENNDEALKYVIIKWLKDNVRSINENQLSFDFNTTPITVNYNSSIEFKTNIISLTNDMFQWGEVKGHFDCSECDSLTSLEGAPRKVGYDFYCGDCISLKSLEGAPETVGYDFYCDNCRSLKSLEGAPKEVEGYFDCSICKSLKSLEGAPKKVGKSFSCNYCDSLTSLKGAPKNVGGDFNCRKCKSLTSLEGAPKKVGRNFNCCKCGMLFAEDDVKKICKVKGKISCLI